MLPWLSWNRNFRLLAVAVFGSGIFFGVQFSLFHNFIVERIGIEAHELGYMEALREVPGFLNALFIAVTILLSPPLLGGVSLIVMGLGLALYSQADNFSAVLIYSFVWSIGFHAWLPLQGTMSLFYSEGEEKGKWLGSLRSVQSLSMLAAIVLCKLAVDVLEFGGLFQIGGVAVAIGGVALMFASRELQTEREPRIVLRKRYWLYYLLSFLQGCRRQIFITFAVFALGKGVWHPSGHHHHAYPNQPARCICLFAVDGLACGQVGRADYVDRKLHRFDFYFRWLRVDEKSQSPIYTLLP